MVTLWYMEIGHPLCVHNDLIENNNNDLRRRKKIKNTITRVLYISEMLATFIPVKHIKKYFIV